MKRVFIVLAVVVALVGILGVSCVGRYNGLVESGENVDKAWAQVENVLQRRADLVPNLVETVKGYAAHEKEVFSEIAQARSALLGARGPEEAADANARLDSSLGRLLAIGENYPALRANENFTRLQDELAGTENRIAVERMRYNEAVAEFNKSIKTFPNVVFARIAGFDEREYFQAAQGAEKVPEVKF